jgi:hypothetical protein
MHLERTDRHGGQPSPRRPDQKEGIVKHREHRGGRAFAVLAIALGVTWSPALAVTSDGFGDGDRNNDAVLDDPDGSGTGVVDSAADTGWQWFRVFKSGENQILRVAHDVAAPAGLGDDNVLIVSNSGEQAYQAAKMDLVSLVNPGDYVRLSFDIRFTNMVDNRDTFRFGLSNSGTTLVDADQANADNVATDVGYFATVATGALPNRARIAENGSSVSAGSLFAVDRTLVGQDPSTRIINDLLPHTMAFMVIRTTGNSAICRFSIDGTEIMQGEDTTGVIFNFDQIGFGSVPLPAISYNLDNVRIETGTVPACEAIPALAIARPIATGATSLTISNISPSAEEIRVFANGSPVGTAIGTPPATAASLAVSTSALASGAVITAKQVVGGVESCVPVVSATVNNCSDVAAVSLAVGFGAGSTQVTVTNVSTTAQTVKVYANGTTLLGTASGNGTTSVTVTTSPLVKNTQIMATQVIGGVEGCMPTTGFLVRSSGLVAVLQDGFGDGDRDNNGAKDDPDNSGNGLVDDAADVGVPWYKVTSASSTLRVGHDAGGLGDDNALFLDAGATQKYLVAHFDPITLSQPGDYVKFSFDFRFTAWPTNRDTFRFGLFDDMATAVTSDQADTSMVANDAGYFATLATGTPVSPNKDSRIARAGPPNTAAGTLFGLDEGIVDEENPAHITNDSLPHTTSITIVRTSLTRVHIEVHYDGVLEMSGDDYKSATVGDVDPVISFNQVGIGEVGTVTPILDLVIDNVKVEAQINPCSDPVFDSDGNKHVDAADFNQFASCATGPQPAAGLFDGLSTACQCLDKNKDGAVDMLDFARFQLCYSPEATVDPACDD